MTGETKSLGFGKYHAHAEKKQQKVVTSDREAWSEFHQ